jgi:hypothetical protein
MRERLRENVLDIVFKKAGKSRFLEGVDQNLIDRCVAVYSGLNFLSLEGIKELKKTLAGASDETLSTLGSMNIMYASLGARQEMMRRSGAPGWTAESLVEAVNSSQIADLTRKYSGVASLDPNSGEWSELSYFLGTLDNESIIQLAALDIPWVSSSCRTIKRVRGL